MQKPNENGSIEHANQHVWYYDIYRRDRYGRDAGTAWLGRISADACYIPEMPRLGDETSTILQLVAVAPSGIERFSPRATALFDWW